MEAKEVRQILKQNLIKSTDVNVTSGTGSTRGMVIITIRKPNNYKIVKALFGNNDKIYISCSNSMMN